MAQQYVATYFSIDVECVATGVEHNAREVAQIALVDQFERCLLNLYVSPPENVKVVSYLTPLTGWDTCRRAGGGFFRFHDERERKGCLLRWKGHQKKNKKGLGKN